MLTPAESPLDPWRRIRFLYRWTIGLWAGWIPFVMLMIGLQRTMLAARWPLVLMFTYMAGFVLVGLLLAAEDCPACDRRFRGVGIGFRLRPPWTSRCGSCGVRIGDAVPRSAPPG